MQIFTLRKPARNGGQIAKEYLKSINVNINFSNCKRRSESTIIRKAKNNCCDGISVPTDINTIVNLVVPKTYQKIILKNGVVSTEIFKLHSRKIKLTYIRKKLIEKHEKYMKCFSKDYMITKNITNYLKSNN